MFSKIIAALIISICFCSASYSQEVLVGPQIVGNSMSSFLDYANSGNRRVNRYNYVPYQHHVIYNGIYDADGSEYQSIMNERKEAFLILKYLKINPLTTKLFSYYNESFKKDED